MGHREKALLGILALSIPFSAFAGDAELWVPALANVVCLAQYPELSATARGAEISKVPEFSQAIGWMKSDAASVCLKSRHLLSTELCTMVINPPPDAKIDHSLEQKYNEEASHLNELRLCLQSGGPPQTKK